MGFLNRRKVFVSHYGGDVEEVRRFINNWAVRQGVFIPKQLGVYDREDFINSTDTAYVMSQIRQKFLGDSSVTIVLMGRCTHSRRYIDWEIKASLQQGNSLPNGLIGIVLPSLSAKKEAPHLPNRFSLNWSNNSPCYADYYWAPNSSTELANWIEQAYNKRSDPAKTRLIQNPNDMFTNNKKCSFHGITH